MLILDVSVAANFKTILFRSGDIKTSAFEPSFRSEIRQM